MRKLCLVLFGVIVFMSGCNNNGENENVTETAATSDTTAVVTTDETMSETTQKTTFTQTEETTSTYVSSETPVFSEISVVNPYETKEIENDGEYKIMELYVYTKLNGELSAFPRKMTVELPSDWRIEDKVFTNGEDWVYTLKVDMWRNILKGDEDDIMCMASESDVYTDAVEFVRYSTDNYEVFYYKYPDEFEDCNCIYVYYFYKNGEFFKFAGYSFYEYYPEHEDVIKRIAESVRF